MKMSMETTSRLFSGMDPTTRAFLEKINAMRGPQLYEMSPEEARNALSKVQAIDVPKLSADVEEKKIPGGPKGLISIRIIRPKGSTETLPVVMYFHGGGWVLGDFINFDRLLRGIANHANA